MLFEEWQKWLDSQFLDAQNEADIQDNANCDQVKLSSAPISSISDISLSSPQTLSPAENAVAEQHNAHPVSKPVSPREELTNGYLTEAVDVPTIDKYLPHFRKSQSVEMPAEQVNTPETSFPLGAAPPVKTVSESLSSEETKDIVMEIYPEAIVEAETNEPEPTPAETSLMQEMPINVSTFSTETDADAILSVESQSEESLADEIPIGSEKQTRKQEVSDPSEIPAPRVSRKVRSSRQNKNEDASKNVNLWDMVPRRMEVLISMNPVISTSTQYNRELKEQRIRYLKVLTDPDISYVDASRILNAHIQIARSPKKSNHLIPLISSHDPEGPKMADIMSFLETQSGKINSYTH